MFSLQEYQHVHLLWFKKRSFTLVWKPNPPLRSVRCTHLRGEWKHNGRVLLPLCIRAASALALLCLRVRCETGVNQALLKRSRWKRLISEIFLLLQCAAAGSARCMKQMLWSSADHALAQVRPCQMFTRALSKNGRSLEPCSIHSLGTDLCFWRLLEQNSQY